MFLRCIQNDSQLLSGWNEQIRLMISVNFQLSAPDWTAIESTAESALFQIHGSRYFRGLFRNAALFRIPPRFESDGDDLGGSASKRLAMEQLFEGDPELSGQKTVNRRIQCGRQIVEHTGDDEETLSECNHFAILDEFRLRSRHCSDDSLSVKWKETDEKCRHHAY